MKWSVITTIRKDNLLEIADLYEKQAQSNMAILGDHQTTFTSEEEWDVQASLS